MLASCPNLDGLGILLGMAVAVVGSTVALLVVGAMSLASKRARGALIPTLLGWLAACTGALAVFSSEVMLGLISGVFAAMALALLVLPGR